MDYIVKAYKDWKLHSQFHEIVPDMDDEYMFNEKQSIRESARSLKKYGSTCCNHIRNNETLIKHEISKTDTLQGIALKYGCTTEQIRRANRLFASDSLFLRQFLLIPVDKSSPYYPQNEQDNPSQQTDPTAEGNKISDSNCGSNNNNNNKNNNNNNNNNESSSSTDSTDSTDATFIAAHFTAPNNSTRPSALPTRPYSIAGELLVPTHEDGSHNAGNGPSGSSSGKQSKSLDSVVAMTPEEENRKCINEFLSKIDSTILESRKYVEKSKVVLTSQSDDDLFATTDIVQRNRQHSQQNNAYKSNQQNHIRHSSTGSASDTTQLLSTTQTRRVQNSLKRLEKQQDEFFEL